jgi:K+-transporting ATPase ATPase C chain
MWFWLQSHRPLWGEKDMSQHVRANLWLLALTLILCSVLYPAVLWVIGQVAFADKAQGSIVVGLDNKPVGSRLIAQPFSGPEYFRPRPSAVGYHAAASGASNWGASNYLLRDRVARTLGPIVKYRDGRLVAPDIDSWFRKTPGLVRQWATDHPDIAKAWAKADPAHEKLVDEWKATHPEAVTQWKSSNQGVPAVTDFAVAYFKDFAREHPGSWPKGSDDPLWSVPAVFFESWLQAHPQAELQSVPADMVMASGSGLDPHITLQNARYQLERVTDAWAKRTGQHPAAVRKKIEALLDELKEAPLGGWFGVPLVNVLEVNLELSRRLTAAE